MKTIRILSVILSALLLFSVLPFFGVVSSAEDEELIALTIVDENGAAIDPQAGISGTHGDTFTVKIKAAGVNSLTIAHGFQFRLTFDPEMLQPVQNGASVSVAGNYSATVVKDGYIKFLWTDLSNLRISRNGRVIAEATFTMIKAGTSVLSAVADSSQGDCFYYVDEDTDNTVDIAVEGTTSGSVTTADSVNVSAAFDPAIDFCFALRCDPTPLDEQATVGVYMSNATLDLYGFSLEVNFDPTKLAFVEGVLDDGFPYGRIVTPEAGKVRVFAATAVNAPATGTADMAQLTFEIIDPDKAEGSEYSLSISFYNNQPTYTLDDNQNTVSIRTVDTVDATLVLLPGSAPSDRYDLNGDGDVDVNDVTALLNHIASVSALPASSNPDLNSDGSVDVTDVTSLLNHIAGY